MRNAEKSAKLILKHENDKPKSTEQSRTVERTTPSYLTRIRKKSNVEEFKISFNRQENRNVNKSKKVPNSREDLKGQPVPTSRKGPK